jgi:hypothetical protein
MLPHAYATGGAFPDVIQLLLDTHMDSALTMYGTCNVQADQSAQLGRQDRPVITSPASIWTRSTIRRRMGLKGRLRTHNAPIS